MSIIYTCTSAHVPGIGKGRDFTSLELDHGLVDEVNDDKCGPSLTLLLGLEASSTS